MKNQIPTGQIEWLINREHVSKSDNAIEKLIRRKAKRGKGWTDKMLKQAIRHAIKTHHANQKLFNHVMRGI